MSEAALLFSGWEGVGGPPEPRSGDEKNEDKKENKSDDSKIRKDPKDIKEIGGPKGPEPTRYGDWEKGGRVTDF